MQQINSANTSTVPFHIATMKLPCLICHVSETPLELGYLYLVITFIIYTCMNHKCKSVAFLFCDNIVAVNIFCNIDKNI